MPDFLLELRSEEIPARMQAGARADLEKLFCKAMDEAGVSLGAVTVWSTPRRLALIARNLPLATAAVSEEIKGPRVGAPPQALDGFLRKTGLTAEQLVERDGVLFAVIDKPGRATAEVLAEAIPAIIRAFPWPKSQRWGAASISTESLRWVRPLSGFVALLGESLVECEIEGIRSSCATRGHRFHCPGDITIGGASDYQEKLRACHVIVDHAERQNLIREGAKAAAAAEGLTLVEDEGLVIENAGLTEWPVPLLGRFDEAYLDVPPEVIQLTARTNQKYFVCEDAAGKLANAFVCTANIAATDGGAGIVAGNRKVLAARLSDARFFWEQDRKKALSQHAEGLARITFHEKLGTVADKVERVAKLARWLVDEGLVKPSPLEGRGRSLAEAEGVGAVDPASRQPDSPHTPALSPEGEREKLAAQAELAARLCKADLVTEMVGEFPELQGLMGGYYARAEGLPDAVADAIRDHYKPVGQSDDVPTAPVTVAVSLADKLDTIGVFFLADMPPSGSKDPFALRRSAIAIIDLVTANSLRIEVKQPIGKSMAHAGGRLRGYELNKALNEIFEARISANDPMSLSEKQALTDEMYERASSEVAVEEFTGRTIQAVDRVIQFLADRLKVQQREAGVRHDLIDAVFALGGEDDLVRLLARVHALQAFVGTPDGTELHAGYKRAANILKKEEFTPAEAAHALEPAEAALLEALAEAGPRAALAVENQQFAAAMAALATLRAPIDAFFESVTVNDADPAKRAFRLALLARFRDAVHSVADFSKIEG